MKPRFLFLISTVFGLFACAPLSLETVVIGETNVKIVSHRADSNNVLFLNVHEDERTSVKALKRYSKKTPINYSYLKHTGERRIQFKLKTDSFNFDPNRMFTDVGRRETLEQGGNYSATADSMLAIFAQMLLNKLPDDGIVIAMHNNTPDNYSILSYAPEGDEEQNTHLLYINPDMDPDDFIYTTDVAIFHALEARKINVILQDNTDFVDDGSLSVYCGKSAIRYVNIETEHGHLNEQIELMQVVLEILYP